MYNIKKTLVKGISTLLIPPLLFLSACKKEKEQKIQEKIAPITIEQEEKEKKDIIKPRISKLEKDVSEGLSDSKKSKSNLMSYNKKELEKKPEKKEIIKNEVRISYKVENKNKSIIPPHKNLGKPSWEINYFEDNNLMEKHITDDGRRFLDFIGYDETLNSLKELLIDKKKKEKNIKMFFELGTFLNSGGLEAFGFPIKIGDIKGDSSSPMYRTSLFQVGYGNEFYVKDYLTLGIEASYIHGELEEKANPGFHSENQINGFTAKGFFILENKQIGKLAVKYSTVKAMTKKETLLADESISIGVSKKAQDKHLFVEPYFNFEFANHPNNSWMYRNTGMRFSEIYAGIRFKVDDGKKFISIDPYLRGETWKARFGTNLEIGTKVINMKLGAFFERSSYNGKITPCEFCSNGKGYNMGFSLRNEFLEIGADYERSTDKFRGKEFSDDSFDFYMKTKL